MELFVFLKKLVLWKKFKKLTFFIDPDFFIAKKHFTSFQFVSIRIRNTGCYLYGGENFIASEADLKNKTEYHYKRVSLRSLTNWIHLHSF